MKNFFEAATVEEVKQRLATLGPDSQRQWGKMSPAQAMAHCAAQMEMVVGMNFPPRSLVGRIFGRMAKRQVLKDVPMRSNMPTDKMLLVTDDRDLALERQRLAGLIERFCAGGPSGCTKHPHSFFGHLTPDEWAVLMYKHVDHHLRQFGA